MAYDKLAPLTKKEWTAIVCIATFVMLLVIFLFKTKQVDARIERYQWSHAERLENRHTRSGSGWRSGAPWGSFDFQGCRSKYHSMECHYVGTDKNRHRVCTPDYRTWCDSWKYYQWVIDHTEYRSGNNFNCSWPNIQSIGETQRVIKSQEYLVTFSDENSEYNFRPDTEAEYLRFRNRGIWEVKVNRAGMVWPGQQKRPH